MIQRTVTVNVTSPSGLYDYTWNNSGNTCVSFSNSTGTTTGSVTTVLTFESEECIESASISITFSKAGCATTIPVVISNFCDNFTTSAITEQPNYKFSVSASSPYCDSFTFQWIYDQSLFTNGGGISNSSGSTIDLNPIAIVFPTSTQVRCIIKDCHGCTKEVSKTVIFKVPSLAERTTVLHEVEDGYVSSIISLAANPSYTGSINWNSAQFSTPNGFSVDRTDNNIIISASNTVTQGAYPIYYTVADTDGIVSQQQVITVQVIPTTSQTISVMDIVAQRECASIVGNELRIYIDDKIVVNTNDGNVINWSTFDFLATPTPTSSNISLEIDIEGKRYISYEIPATTGVDVFKYTVCDTNGSCASTGTVTVQLVCNSVPSIINKSACVSCGDSATINILGGASTTAPFQLNTITIVSNPTKGTIEAGSGTITYTPNTGTVGADSFTYNIKNSDGYTSNTATANITIVCAGENTIHLVCN